MVPPGGEAREFFKCLYPGAFIYHCAVSNMDEHISRGMFGMILVEPEGGLEQLERRLQHRPDDQRVADDEAREPERPDQVRRAPAAHPDDG